MDINLTMNFNSTDSNVCENYYSNLTKWDVFKFITFVIKIILSVTGSFMLYGVIWYERFSADLRYRTLMNQMLSHLCIFHISGGPFFILGFLINFSFQPQSEIMCHLITFIGRLLFLCCVAHLVLRQLIKYFYFFHWKHITSIHDDFIAIFLLTSNVMLNTLFAFVTFFFGHHNAEITFHCCTGQKISENIARTVDHFRKSGNSTIEKLWFRTKFGPGNVSFIL
jgi:hypothetical protein